MENTKNILIVQHYSPNKGDSAVICSMLYSIRRQIRGCNITVSSYDPDVTYGLYCVPSVNWLFNYKGIKEANSKIKKIIVIIEEVLFFINLMPWFILQLFHFNFPIINKTKKKVINSYYNADIVILPGGHFFTSLNKLPIVVMHCIALWAGMIIKKPTYIYSQTIGPFRGFGGILSSAISKFTLDRVTLITVREEGSYEFLKEFGVSRPKVILTAECVFLMPTLNKNETWQFLKNENIFPNKKPKIGITIHHIYYNQYFTKEEYKNLMVQAADFLTAYLKADLIFIPMEMIGKTGGDRPLAKEIIAKTKNSNSCYLLEKEYTPLQTASIIGAMDFFIGTKTHSIIFSLMNLIPTFSISYHPKSTAFMKQLGQHEYAIDLKNFNLPEFCDKIKLLNENKEKAIQIMGMRLENIKALANKNNELINQLL